MEREAHENRGNIFIFDKQKKVLRVSEEMGCRTARRKQVHGNCLWEALRTFGRSTQLLALSPNTRFIRKLLATLITAGEEFAEEPLGNRHERPCDDRCA